MQLRRTAGIALAALVLPACAGRQRVDPDAALDDVLGTAPDGAALLRGGAGGGFGDASAVYQRMGLLAPGAPMPFVGTVRFLAGPRPDSTLALLAVSLQNRALTFVREDDRYRAVYEVRAEFRQGARLVRRVEAQQVVRVAGFRETGRGDESVIFQQTVALAPGAYTLTVAVRDGGSARSATGEAPVTVPPLAAPGLSAPITVHEATPRTRSTPRRGWWRARAPPSPSGATRGRVLPRGYGADAELPVRLTARGDDGRALWTGTAPLVRRGALLSAVVRVPLAPLGVGRVATVTAGRGDAPDGAGTPVFVAFGDELPVTTFDEMVSYLRYFDEARVAALRAAPAAGRAAAWAELLRATDPAPTTPENEALRDYFGRLALANARYREEGGGGWLTDRGARVRDGGRAGPGLPAGRRRRERRAARADLGVPRRPRAARVRGPERLRALAPHAGERERLPAARAAARGSGPPASSAAGGGAPPRARPRAALAAPRAGAQGAPPALAAAPLAYAAGLDRRLMVAGLGALVAVALAVEVGAGAERARAPPLHPRRRRAPAPRTSTAPGRARPGCSARTSSRGGVPAPFAVAAMWAVGVGDASAAIVGRWWGERRGRRREAAGAAGPPRGAKTYAGSAACFLAALAGARWVAGLPLAAALLAALCAALAERPRAPGDDNLRIVLAVGSRRSPRRCSASRDAAAGPAVLSRRPASGAAGRLLTKNQGVPI
jgi:GWxTD domain-containing protein